MSKPKTIFEEIKEKILELMDTVSTINEGIDKSLSEHFSRLLEDIKTNISIPDIPSISEGGKVSEDMTKKMDSMGDQVESVKETLHESLMTLSDFFGERFDALTQLTQSKGGGGEASGPPDLSSVHMLIPPYLRSEIFAGCVLEVRCLQITERREVNMRLRSVLLKWLIQLKVLR